MEKPTPQRPYNLSAGPAILAPEVIARAAEAVLGIHDGLSVLEVSHRWPWFQARTADIEDRMRRLLAIPDTHRVLFMQGGARGQFAQIPLNFLTEGRGAGFIETGSWSVHARTEAAYLGTTQVLASGEDSSFTRLPEWPPASVPSDLAYIHSTSNNTIVGTQWATLPDTGDTPHICDMSSDFLSRPLDIASFGMIYAGAQKNAGPAGVTLAIIDAEFMERGRNDIPKIWQYRVLDAKQSAFNTPPVFSIHAVGLVLEWLEGLGGLTAIAARNQEKANLIYNAIEASNGLFRPIAPVPADRSRMNLTWTLRTPALQNAFLQSAESAGFKGLAGHRSVGGIRASLYNAFPVEGAQKLAAFMNEFAHING